MAENKKATKLICEKCGHGLDEHIKFCQNCGSRITRDAHGIKTGTKIPTTALITVGILVVGLLFGALIFSRGSPNSGSAQSTTQGTGLAIDGGPQCRQVSYTDQEAYQEEQCQTVPYTDTVCDAVPLVYSKTAYTCSRGGLIGDWSVAKCTINNLDSESGVFTVNIGVVVAGANVGETQSYSIYPQTSHSFEYSVKADMSSCYCNEVNVPTKQVCRDVIKTRQDCQYVTKYRPVTKYRQECS